MEALKDIFFHLNRNKTFKTRHSLGPTISTAWLQDCISFFGGIAVS